jgi:uncharacterized membrane protein
MNYPDALFPQTWALGAFLPFAVCLSWCVLTAPWRRLADRAQSNVWFGTVALLSLVWSMQAGVKPGLNLHLLGATMFTLMFGRQLAILGLCAVLAAVTVNGELRGQAGWLAYGLNALVLAVFPPLLADLIRRGMERFLPANFFVYVFVAAFFGAAAVVTATGLLSSALLWAAGIYPASLLGDDYLPYFFLLGFAEAWLNGAMVTLMVVYLPHWVGSFDDRRYLLDK